MVTIGTAPVSAPALARTYSHPSYADPWECAEDYQRVMDYSDSNPKEGDTAVGNDLGLPRGRVRSWINGRTPRCVQAIQVAEEHGWLAPSLDSGVFRGLNVLAAWIFSGGSIRSQGYVPHFVVKDDGEARRMNRAANEVGVDIVTSREGNPRQAREVCPKNHASVLGRILDVLGAPVGEKNENADISLPQYLSDAPTRVRQDFVRIYVSNRGSPLPKRSGAIQLLEARPHDFHRSLAEFVSQVSGGEVSVTKGGIYINGGTAETISEWPMPFDGED